MTVLSFVSDRHSMFLQGFHFGLLVVEGDTAHMFGRRVRRAAYRPASRRSVRGCSPSRRTLRLSHLFTRWASLCRVAEVGERTADSGRLTVLARARTVHAALCLNLVGVAGRCHIDRALIASWQQDGGLEDPLAVLV